MQYLPPQTRRRSTRGFSLVELLIVVVIIGTLTLMVVPRLEPLWASRSVSAARSAFTGLYNRARMAAVQSRQVATVTVTGNVAVATITSAGGVTQRVGQAVVFDSLYGVQAVASPTSLQIQSSGLVTVGLPFALVLTRSDAADTINITGYGKLK
ncbi:MAG TPA: prepilin-type N-terminal cleavage/methylation domain-containing protein [Gemmatimonadales bacterium]|nr:prepilin-type N-terminal cleavage/methylation domain-containing protein [Gemmatimonadales bacterium]